MKKASVLLNSYNRVGPWLEQAIMSVVNQTYEGPIELILVDDGSDNQHEIPNLVKKYAEILELKLRLMPHSGNLAIRRNDALELVTGDYIFLLDDDNSMAPTRIAACIAHLETCQECDAVYHLSRYMDTNGKLGDLVNFYRTGEVDMDSILTTRNHIDSGEVCVRRSTFEKIGMFDERCIILEDWDLWRRILTFGKMHFLGNYTNEDVMLSYYRSQHSGRRVFAMSNHDTAGMRYVLDKSLKQNLTCSVVLPMAESLTFSQFDVGIHFLNGSKRFLSDTPDVKFCFAPFRLSDQTKHKINGESIATVHVEDPYAFDQNLRFTQIGVDWIFTNDSGCLERYKQNGRKISVMPSMAAYDSREPGCKKEWDVVLIGTPYMERLKFMEKLVELLPSGIKFLAAGPPIPGMMGWSLFGNKITVREDQLDTNEVMNINASAKVVLVMNRRTGYNPITPSRGFVEASSGSMVLLDTQRPAMKDYFKSGKEMEFFMDINECVDKIKHYLANEKERESIARAGCERAKEYTYEKRIRRALQLIQANRESSIP